MLIRSSLYPQSQAESSHTDETPDSIATGRRGFGFQLLFHTTHLVSFSCGAQRKWDCWGLGVLPRGVRDLLRE